MSAVLNGSGDAAVGGSRGPTPPPREPRGRSPNEVLKRSRRAGRRPGGAAGADVWRFHNFLGIKGGFTRRAAPSISGLNGLGSSARRAAARHGRRGGRGDPGRTQEDVRDGPPARAEGQALNVKLISCKSHANICKRASAAGQDAPASSLLGEGWGGFASGSA